MDPADARRQVEHVVDAFHCPDTALPRGQVDRFERDLFQQVVEVGQAAARKVVGHDHVGAPVDQMLGQVGADEPPTTRH